MNRKETAELLPIIKAFSDGKTIQHLNIIKDKWEDVDEFVYHGSVKSYRIKPEQESKYRPFKDAEECWQEMLNHQPFGWIKDEGCYFSIVSVSRIDVSLANCSGDLFTQYFNEVKDDFTFADGTPFGMKEEE